MLPGTHVNKSGTQETHVGMVGGKGEGSFWPFWRFRLDKISFTTGKGRGGCALFSW